eukprot:Ihof_evm6s261 gene=Ihof_evmTU6s261
MILLEFHNGIIEDTFKRAFSAEKPEALEIVCTDFDGVLYHISTPESKTKILLSAKWGCYKELEAAGVQSVIDREYQGMVTQTEAGYDVSLLIDLENPVGPKEDIIKKCSLLKRNLFAAPFEKCFDLQLARQTADAPISVQYRNDSAVYVLAQSDRVTVIFSTTFHDPDDVVIGKVFLQEFVDARKKVQEAPQVIFSKEPPAELAGLNLKTGGNISYIAFVLFIRHFRTNGFKGPVNEDPQRENCINLIQTFRDYFHYHIKCSKAYLHCRMRARVATSLKILNRARPEVKTEKKTA